VISVANRSIERVLQILTAPNGVNTNVAALAQLENTALTPIPAKSVFTQNVASEVAEKAGDIKYTAIYVYCDKVSNSQREKFRAFSGSLQMAIEVRVSLDRIEGIEQQSQLYTGAVTQTLSQNLGDWGKGLFYAGAYDVSFGPVKHGGRNFIKTAKISFQVDASVD